MQEPIQNKILAQFPDLPVRRSLLAVSAGLDSVVTAHLFATAGWPFAIAHCNFQLRGEDSRGDERFVQSLAGQWGVPFFTTAFDTLREAEAAGVSIQMIARDLRYEWLEKVRREHGFDYLITAHHLNDSIETSLLNQTRGTGIRGLTGIPLRQGALIRPMLLFTRAELAAFAQTQGIVFREDSSNSKDEYYRNRIRHLVIPVLQSINPALAQTYRNNLQIWKESAYLLQWAQQNLREKYVTTEAEQLRIDLRFIADHRAAAPTLLYEWLREFGFHSEQLTRAIEGARGQPGAIWYSATHRLLLDREAFLLDRLPIVHTGSGAFAFPTPETTLSLPDGSLSAHQYVGQLDFEGGTSPWEAHLDAGRVIFPLSIRHWLPGDSFCPLGMYGRHKKVQDFFSDQKISRFDKEKIWLVCSADGDIIWIVGHRIDERYKITEATELVLTLCYTSVTDERLTTYKK